MNDVTALADAARALIAAAAGGEAFLDGWPAADVLRVDAPVHLPVLGVLPTLTTLAVPGTRALTLRIAEMAGRLTWRQTYGPEDFGAAFLDRYGWTELVGLRGPIASERLACGVLMLGSSTHYPAHAHAAEELYIPLAGTAWWQRGDAGWARRPPGDVIHHPPWVAHAMRTEREPLLALYVCQGGDLAAKPAIVGDD